MHEELARTLQELKYVEQSVGTLPWTIVLDSRRWDDMI